MIPPSLQVMLSSSSLPSPSPPSSATPDMPSCRGRRSGSVLFFFHMPDIAVSAREDPTTKSSLTMMIVLFSAILPTISPKYDISSRNKHPGLVGVAFRGAGEGGCRCHRHHHPSLRGGQQRPCLLVRLRLRTTARTTAAVTDGTTASGHCGRRCKLANDDADGETGRKPQQQRQRQWRRWQWQ